MRGSANTQARHHSVFRKLCLLTQPVTGHATRQAQPGRAEAAALGAQPRLPGSLTGPQQTGSPRGTPYLPPCPYFTLPVGAPPHLSLPGAGPAVPPYRPPPAPRASVPPRACPLPAQPQRCPAAHRASPGPSAALRHPPLRRHQLPGAARRQRALAAPPRPRLPAGPARS